VDGPPLFAIPRLIVSGSYWGSKSPLGSLITPAPLAGGALLGESGWGAACRSPCSSLSSPDIYVAIAESVWAGCDVT